MPVTYTNGYELYTGLNKIPWLNKSKVYIWGTYVLQDSTRNTGQLTSLIENIHMNQGSRSGAQSYLRVNGPWQDGAVTFMPPKGVKDMPVTVYIYYADQTFDVDSAGEPRNRSGLDTLETTLVDSAAAN
ncbi:MAG: DUF2278 family protein [Bacteroidota bacterium]